MSTSDKHTAFVSDFSYSAQLYLGVVSRPDITYAVDVLTRYLKHPTYLSSKAAYRVLNYLSNHAGSKIDMHV